MINFTFIYNLIFDENKYVNMKTIVINASPRKTWNTAEIMQSAQKGAESVGAETEYFNLYDELADGMILNKDQLDLVIRMLLREDIGVSVYVPYRFKLFIGYDYLMSVRTSKNLAPIMDEIDALGLLIFEFTADGRILKML